MAFNSFTELLFLSLNATILICFFLENIDTVERVLFVQVHVQRVSATYNCREHALSRYNCREK